MLQYLISFEVRVVANDCQSADAAKGRYPIFYIHPQIVVGFSTNKTQNVEAEVVGDPMNSKTTVGPLVRESQRQTLVSQVEDAKSKGGKILTGGKIIAGEGYFYEPTVITNVNHQMVILTEEVFGPAHPFSQWITRPKLYGKQTIQNLG